MIHFTELTTAKTRLLLRRLFLSSVLRSSAVYTITTFASAAAPFLMLPVFTRVLTPSDYGLVAMYQAVLGIVSSFVGLNLHGAVIRRFYDREAVDLRCYISNCMMIVGVGAVIVGTVVWLAAGPLISLTKLPEPWLEITAVAAAADFITLLVLSLWQVRQEPLKYGLLQVGQTLVGIGLALLLVVGLEMGWRGRVASQLITSFVFASAGLIILQRGGWLKWVVRPELVRNALSFGIPLIPHAVGMYAMSVIDRLLLSNIQGVGETGVYVVAVQVSMIIWLLLDSFNKAWTPWFFEQLKRNDAIVNRRIVGITYLYNVTSLMVALVFAWGAGRMLPIAIGPEFVAAAKYLPWICAGYAFNGMYKMVTNYCFYAEKTRLISLVTLCTTAVSVVSGYILITRNGTVGAAQATMIAFFTSFVFTWIAATRVYPMPWFSRAKMA